MFGGPVLPVLVVRLAVCGRPVILLSVSVRGGMGCGYPRLGVFVVEGYWSLNKVFGRLGVGCSGNW